MRTTTGGVAADDSVAISMSRLTAWSRIGIVTISMINSTSITSISGAAPISISTSGSSLPGRRCIAIMQAAQRRTAARSHGAEPLGGQRTQ